MTVPKADNVIYIDRCTVIAPCAGQKHFKNTHNRAGLLDDGCSCAYCGEHIWKLQQRISGSNKRPFKIVERFCSFITGVVKRVKR